MAHDISVKFCFWTFHKLLQKQKNLTLLTFGCPTCRCITPELLTWILSSVSVIPPSKLLLHKLIQLMGIKLLSYGFLEIFGS